MPGRIRLYRDGEDLKYIFDGSVVTVTGGGGAGEANNGTNLGQYDIYAGKSSTTLQFRGLQNGTDITLSQNGSNIVISATGGGGSGLSQAQVLARGLGA